MQANAFWKAVIMDNSNLLERFVQWLADHNVRFCLLAGQAVNAYVEPVVGLDLDIVVAADQLGRVRADLNTTFAVESSSQSLKVSAPGSDLRVQIQLDRRYAAFLDRAAPREVLGLMLPVANLEDVLQGKVWAAQDASRRSSKRQKDLGDIARLLEKHTQLLASVPAAILDKLI